MTLKGSMIWCHCKKNWIHLFLGDSKFRKIQWTNSCVIFWRLKCWKKWTHILQARQCRQLNHTANNSMDDLCNTFEDWIINCPLWPIHTPTAMPCNDYLWRSLEDNTYKTIYTHKMNLSSGHASLEISGQELQTVFSNMFIRCQASLRVWGI